MSFEVFSQDVLQDAKERKQTPLYVVYGGELGALGMVKGMKPTKWAECGIPIAGFAV